MISKRADEAEAPARGTETQGAGRKSGIRRLGAEARTATPEQTKSEDHLMEQVVERSNLWLAYQRVVKNKGAPGSMTSRSPSSRTGSRCTGRA